MSETPIDPRHESGWAWKRPVMTRHRFVLHRFSGDVLEVGDVHFHFDSAVLLPNLPGSSIDIEDPETWTITGLSVLRACILYATREPSAMMLIAGHTDTSGGDEYNVELAQRRADNALHACLGNREDWAAICKNHHQVKDYQEILIWVTYTWNWPCAPGPSDNIKGQKTTGAIRSFQSLYSDQMGHSIAVDGIVGPETWAAFFDMYSLRLKDLLETDMDGVQAYRARIKFLDEARRAVGCGEHFPIEAKRRDNYRAPENRRVEIMFFQPGNEPPLKCHLSATACDPTACLTYDARYFGYRHIEVQPEEPPCLARIWIDDALVGPLVQSEVSIQYADGSDGSGQTDDVGRVYVRSDRGNHVDLSYAIEDRDVQQRIYLRPPAASSHDGAWQRLVNLRYVHELAPPPSPEMPDEMAAALEEFQADHGLEPTGELDGESAEALQVAHDADERPWEDREWVEEPPQQENEEAPKAAVA